MKNRLLFAASILLAGCAVGTRPVNEPTAAWSSSTKILPPVITAPTDVTERPALGPSWHARSYRASERVRVMPVSTRTPSESAPAAMPAVALTVNSKELVKADSLLNTLQAQNQAATADTKKEVKRVAQVRHQRRTPTAGLTFKPTNLQSNDTVFVDKPGVRMAFWLEGDNVRMRIVKGVLAKGQGPGGLDVTVKPGFDWQPYRTGLLVVGVFFAAVISLSLCLSIFHVNKQTDPALNGLA
jgi:hypothetical protein